MTTDPKTPRGADVISNNRAVISRLPLNKRRRTILEFSNLQRTKNIEYASDGFRRISSARPSPAIAARQRRKIPLNRTIINITIYNIRESTHRPPIFHLQKPCLTYSIFMIPSRWKSVSRLNRDGGGYNKYRRHRIKFAGAA